MLEFKIYAFWESSNLGLPERRTLTKDKSDGISKVLSTELDHLRGIF